MIEWIDSLDDPRIAPYRDMKDRELARHGDRFIAEGEQVVRRLLNSDYPVESLLLSRKRHQEIAPLAPPGLPVYVVENDLIPHVVGFKFHNGVMGCGRRKPRESLDEVMSRATAAAGGGPLTLVVLPDLASTENLGSLIRISAAFGAGALVLGERSCDPFWRQSVRVSMGTIFSLPLVQSDDLLRDLRRLRERWGVQHIGTVLADDAEPLAQATRPERIALLFGNEAQGLGDDLLAECDRRVTIPMKLGTDSLNVAIAAAVCLYHFTKE